MFQSGLWKGFWQQEGWGQQPMEAFELHFRDGLVHGSGVDVVGRFTVDGEYDDRRGTVEFVKQYLGKHSVTYTGQPNGEGAIVGTWQIVMEFGQHRWESNGPFLIQPEVGQISEEEPIFEIVPRKKD